MRRVEQEALTPRKASGARCPAYKVSVCTIIHAKWYYAATEGRNSEIGLRDSEIGLRDSEIGLRDSEIGLRDSEIAPTVSYTA